MTSLQMTPSPETKPLYPQAGVLGFFEPSNSSNFYIGMWHSQVTPQTVVWVANRENPVSYKSSSKLNISDGNLVLFNESGIPIWSTGSASVQAVLHDDGNLLPGGKIAYNKITKKHQRLTSWKNSDDPAPGLFSLEISLSDNSFTILWNSSRRYWSSGSWNGQILSLVPEMTHN
ncbi:hypothetical protein TIFTF001_030323 [Ficus carica]|uniref:Bulb-type lectin domain-containing protein n=1 Tax=Ficus carica TaxID=3494 RepID=A0AA88DT05_FICCA|nr:hypothetical protein TIFTF001_030323 [Ficus carica]